MTMVQERYQLIPSGYIDDPGNPFGTETHLATPKQELQP